MMWLGRPGALVQLRMPARDYDRAPQLQAAVRRTLGGGYAVDRPIRSARQWSMAWVWLTRAEWTHLHAFATRQYGPGPYALIDPATGNFLTAQQASGTDALADASGWSMGGVETLTSSTAQAWQGSRSLLWALPASVSSGVLTYSPPVASWYGWPTPDGQAWAFSAYCRSGGTDTTFDVRARIRWMSSAGAQVSISTGTYTALSSSAWTRVSVTATAPAGAAYASPGLQVDATDVSGAAHCYVDGSQLELFELTAWQPGEGLPQVSIVGIDERVPWIERRNGAMTLVEVGA